MSRSTGTLCSGVLGGIGAEFDLGLFFVLPDLDLLDIDDETDLLDAGWVEFEPVDELVLPTLRLLLVLVLAMVLFFLVRFYEVSSCGGNLYKKSSIEDAVCFNL